MGFKELFGLAALRRALLSLAVTLTTAPLAFAAEHVVEPHDWQFGFQEAATPVKERIAGLHHELLIIITCIAALVMILLLYVMVRFNARAHPVPSRTSHNTWIEIAWTVIPVLILLAIAIPSFKLMYYMDKTQKADMTIKVTGHQWYWTYEYPDFKDVSFDSNIIPPEEAVKSGKKRLLDVDNRLVVPVGENVRVLVAGTDVMHSWFVPSFGVQEYAVPGRLNESWFNVEKPGLYYGQCNQICGVNHAFMPIVVEAVSKEDFQKFISAKEKAAANGTAPVATGKTAAAGGAVHLAAAAE
ncbi:MAG TPA: cytochrome c oxidase subunit II [Stellaceae bacterium]|nr:cytochrome c oxidase subunit II [Stellaceae bacterium]